MDRQMDRMERSLENIKKEIRVRTKTVNELKGEIDDIFSAP